MADYGIELKHSCAEVVLYGSVLVFLVMARSHLGSLSADGGSGPLRGATNGEPEDMEVRVIRA